MTDDIKAEYFATRAKHPLMTAKTALAVAKSNKKDYGWEQTTPSHHVRSGASYLWQREVEGFTITLEVEDESMFPIPDKHGDTDYGKYVDESRSEYSYEWEGQWPEPIEHAPLGIPYTSIRYSGPGWVQSEGTGYFIPDGIEEQFKHFRQSQSKSVSWDMTKQWVEDQLTMLFSSPLTNLVVFIKAHKEGVELSSTAMGTDVEGDSVAVVFQMVEEYGMVEEVIEDAKSILERLVA